MSGCYNSAVDLAGAIDVEVPGAHVRFTGRDGGVSAGALASLNLSATAGDDPGAVAENRRRAAGGRPLAAVRQIHGTRVVVVDGPPDAGAPPHEADGLATTAEDLALLVLTADCLPVALATPAAAAMVHAGWRGLAGGVLEDGVGALRALDPDGELQAVIGPGAGGCCYEVGDEVAARFPGWARDGRRIDLKAVATERLRDAGVARVADVGRCTMCEPDAFYSHRAGQGERGRQGGLIWRAPCPS
ncbi:MAG TPA: polyphenol oxidase family protein [Baekduia sp.]|nr:polyphenol oxidase family protein [Baekduia sp.]